MAIFIVRTQTVGGIQYLQNTVVQERNIDAATKYALMQGGGALDAGPDSSSVAAYYGQVGNKCRIPGQIDTVNKQARGSRWHRTFANLQAGGWQIEIPNFWMNSGGGGESAPGAAMGVNAAIEYPFGTLTRVTFGGSSSGTASNKGTLISDFITVPIPRAAKFGIHLFLQCASGIVLSAGGEGEYTAQLGETTTDDRTQLAVSGLGDTTMVVGQAITTTTGGFGVGVCAILGSTTEQTVFGLGDSYWQLGDSGQYPQTDPAASGDIDQGVGILERSLNRRRAYINAGRSGQSLSSMVSGGTGYQANLLRLSKYCTHAFVALGANDINGGDTAANMVANASALQTLYGMPFYWATIMPVTVSSSDGWTTAYGQDNGVNNANRQTFNAKLRASQIPRISGALDIAAVVEAGTSGKWKSNGRVLTDVAMNSDSGTLTSTSANFTSADIGKICDISGTGTHIYPNIRDVSSATTAVMTANATSNFTGGTALIGTGSYTYDGLHARWFGINLIATSRALAPEFL